VIDEATSTVINKADEQKNAPELPIGRFLTSNSLGGNRVILAVRPRKQSRKRTCSIRKSS